MSATHDRFLGYLKEAIVRGRFLKAENIRLERINHNAALLCKIEFDVAMYNCMSKHV